MENRTLLQGLIEIYENDFSSGYEGEGKTELDRIFLKLIMYVSRLTNDIRYCSKKDCPCSPERHIRRILLSKNDDIFNKLLQGNHGLSEIPLPMIRKELKKFM